MGSITIRGEKFKVLERAMDILDHFEKKNMFLGRYSLVQGMDSKGFFATVRISK